MGRRPVVACSPRRAVVAHSPGGDALRRAVVAHSPGGDALRRAGLRYVSVPDRLTRQSTGYDARVPSEIQQLSQRGLGPAPDIR